MNITRLVKLMSKIYDKKTKYDLYWFNDPDSREVLLNKIEKDKCRDLDISIFPRYPFASVHMSSAHENKFFYMRAILNCENEFNNEIVCGLDSSVITLSKKESINLEIINYDYVSNSDCDIETLTFDEENISDTFFRLSLSNDYNLDIASKISIIENLERYYECDKWSDRNS